MNSLAEKFPDIVFRVLYTREGHPGENLGPHRTPAGKMHHARLLLKDDDDKRRTGPS